MEDSYDSDLDVYKRQAKRALKDSAITFFIFFPPGFGLRNMEARQAGTSLIAVIIARYFFIVNKISSLFFIFFQKYSIRNFATGEKKWKN